MNPLRRIFILAVVALWSAASAPLAAAGDAKKAIFAWREWKSIDKAIELRELDDPSDIIEKAEIIEDRIDEMARERDRLDEERKINIQRLADLRNQREVLRDLAEIQRGGDVQTRQRLHDLTEQIQREEYLLRLRRESIAGLDAEMDRFKIMAAEYRRKAEELRQKEGGAR